MNTFSHNKKIHNTEQQGFVLVLALIMLAVLTLIGVSSMNSANIELKATANAQQHQIAFNGVQSVLEFVLSDQGAAPVIDYQIMDKSLVQTATTTVPKVSNLTASVKLTGCTKAEGSSLEEGKGFSYNFFDIQGSGANTSGTAKSLQGQGVRYPAASC
ncbi:MAG TPA: hypothetical protein ENJ11_05115 [Gammaproteobacteria bacterium]|nr:hypothetical protein [Gammaproteobacteria bacterium]